MSWHTPDRHHRDGGVVTTTVSTTARTTGHRRAGLLAGVSLLAMAVLAGWANLAVLEALIVPDDADLTTRHLIESGWQFPAATAAMAAVVVLDIVVAWQLWVFLAPVDRRLAALAGWLRGIYAVVFAVAIAELVGAVRVIAGLDGPTSATPAVAARVMSYLEDFHAIWDPALALFGLHLLVVAVLAWRSGFMPRWIAALVALAGVGYLVDALGQLLSESYTLNLGRFTFVGEVVLLGWLILIGLRRESGQAQPGPGRGGPAATATTAGRPRDARPAP